MLPDWIVVFPPLLVVTGVLLTKRMIPSFIAGIVSAALIATRGNIVQALTLTCNKLWVSTGLDKLTSLESFLSSWNLLIFLFLISMGMLIALLSQTGAAQAYASLVQKKVHTKKGAELASLILSLVFFIDDYFSALTVGSVMRPLAQHYKVHPVKLAFLTTAMATPITLISPISSWVGEIVLQLKQVGIGPASSSTIIAIDPYSLFLQSIPAMFYAILMIISAWYIVLRGISYGPMTHYDKEAISLTPKPLMSTDASFFDFLFPLILLILNTVLTLLYTGNCVLFGGSATIAGALKAGSVHQALFIGGVSSLFISTLYFYLKGLIRLPEIKTCAKQGFNLMFPSLLVLVCAWALGNILKNDLQTGSYLATIVSSFITLELFPVVCFLFAGLIAWMIGSAWATIALMFPLVIGMLQKLLLVPLNSPLEAVPLLIPIIGATLSGCVIGTQVSLLSDNPIMSSASTGASHVEHVKTMAWYVVPIGIATAVAYILNGSTLTFFGLSGSIYLSLAAGILLSFLLLELAHSLFKGKNS